MVKNLETQSLPFGFSHRVNIANKPPLHLYYPNMMVKPIYTHEKPGPELSLKIFSAIVMLLAIGLATAMWSYSLNLKIKTTIDTGSADVKFGDIFTDNPPGHVDPGYDKNVATRTAELVEVEDEAIKMKFAGIGSTIPNGYFDKSSAMDSYKEFIDKAKASIDTLEVTTQGVFRGYPR